MSTENVTTNTEIKKVKRIKIPRMPFNETRLENYNKTVTAYKNLASFEEGLKSGKITLKLVESVIVTNEEGVEKVEERVLNLDQYSPKLSVAFQKKVSALFRTVNSKVLNVFFKQTKKSLTTALRKFVK